jgi:transposase InsO family protein
MMMQRGNAHAGAVRQILRAQRLRVIRFVTHDGRTLRMLTLIDEYTRECLAIRVARRLGRCEVIEALADVMLYRGIPENIRSDNGPEFVAEELRKWLAKVPPTRLRNIPALDAFLHDLPVLFRGTIYAWFPAHVASCLEALILPN